MINFLESGFVFSILYKIILSDSSPKLTKNDVLNEEVFNP